MLAPCRTHAHGLCCSPWGCVPLLPRLQCPTTFGLIPCPCPSVCCLLLKQVHHEGVGVVKEPFCPVHVKPLGLPRMA